MCVCFDGGDDDCNDNGILSMCISIHTYRLESTYQKLFRW